MNQPSFEEVNRRLLSDAAFLIPSWCPGGKVRGREYVAGSVSGGQGTSFSVNLDTGKWSDFATDERGGDLISLYAAIKNIGQGEALKELSGELPEQKITPPEKKKPSFKIGKPPRTAPPPQFNHYKYGQPKDVHKYRDKDDVVLFYIARYEPPNDRKQFIPYCWDEIQEEWINKSYPKPRPLWNLNELATNPKKAVLIVEGEKAALAAKKNINAYVVTTWPGGSSAASTVNWSELHGREKILIWPDADEAGLKASKWIANKLVDHVGEIKVLDVSKEEKGADAFDFFEGDRSFFPWAKSVAYVFKKDPPPTPPYQKDMEILPPEMPPMPEMDEDMLKDMVESQQVDATMLSVFSLWEKLGLVRAANGASLVANALNVKLIFKGMPKFRDLVWYDSFHYKIFIQWPGEEPREINDADYFNITTQIQSDLSFNRVSKELVSQAVDAHAFSQRRSEPMEWLKSLKWDGLNRVDDFFVNYFGVNESDYATAVSKNFWVSMVARINQPGCKVDNMVILEGKQGAFKSTALKTIASPWYVESNEGLHSKDFFQHIQGKLIVEIAELASFQKAEMNTIKKIVSTATDRFRAPYGRTSNDYPRQCVFVGTTNDVHYLRDETGARRFWPLSVGRINISGLLKDREQLFAEAFAMLKEGATWHEVPQSANKEQELRRERDAWEDDVTGYLDGRERVTVAEIAVKCLEMPLERLHKPSQNRIAKILRLYEWEPEKSPTKLPGSRKSVQYWRPKDLLSDSTVQHSQGTLDVMDQPKKVINYADPEHLKKS